MPPKKGKKCKFPFYDGGKYCPGPTCCNLDDDPKGDWCSTERVLRGRKWIHVPGHWRRCTHKIGGSFNWKPMIGGHNDAKIPRSKFQISDIFDEVVDAGAQQNVSTPFLIRIT